MNIQNRPTQERINTVSPIEADELAKLERRYRQSLIHQFEKLTFRGIASSNRPQEKYIELPLEDVYVELKAIADIPEAADTYSADERRFMWEAEQTGLNEVDETRAQLDVMRYERWRAEAREEQGQNRENEDTKVRLERRSIHEIVADQPHTGLVILGDPGSGKTTLLHYLALTYAKRAEASPAPIVKFVCRGAPLRSPKSDTSASALLPIFVPFAAYDDYLRCHPSGISLEDFLAVYYKAWRNFSGLEPLFQQALQEGRALLLLDGLDEVLETATRQHVAEQAETLLRQALQRGNRAVVTSRVVGYREASLSSDLQHVTVLDFGRTEIDLFATQWCRAYEAFLEGGITEATLARAAQEKQALIDDVGHNPSIERLASNPFLLVLLAILRRQRGFLPSQRTALYEYYVELFLDHWELNRSQDARQIMPTRFDRAKAMSYLTELAFWLHTNRPSGTVNRQDLVQVLSRIASRWFSESSDERQIIVDEFLYDMRHFAGLLAERGRDAYGFLHLTFQEYFVAKALIEMPFSERWVYIHQNLHNPRWREPILLCVGALAQTAAKSTEANQLMEAILAAESEHEAILHRDLLLASSIMADDVPLPTSLYDLLYHQLTPLLDAAIPTVQNAAMTAMAHLARLQYQPARAILHQRLQNTNLRGPVIHNCLPLLSSPLGDEFCRILCDYLHKDEPQLAIDILRVLQHLVMQNLFVRHELVGKLDKLGYGDAQDALIYVLAPTVEIDQTVRDAFLKLFDRLHPFGDLSYGFVATTLSPLVERDEVVWDTFFAQLTHEDEDSRRHALNALAPHVKTNPTIRTRIIEMLADDEPAIVAVAISSLGPLAETDEHIRTTLIQMRNHEDHHYQEALIEAFSSHLLRDDDLLEYVIGKLEHDHPSVREVAIRSLSPLILVQSNPSAMAIRAKFLGILDNPSFYGIRLLIMKALASYLEQSDPIDEEILRKFMALLQDYNAYIREAAIDALAPFMSGNEVIRDAILPMLDDEEPSVSKAAANALSPLLDTQGALCNQVLQRLDDIDKNIRAEVIETFAPLSQADDYIRTALIAGLNDADRHVRGEAVRGLKPLLASSPDIRQAIVHKLQDDHAWVREDVLRVLSPFAATDSAICEAMIPFLEMHDYEARLIAFDALTPLLHTKPAVYNTMVAMLNHDDISLQNGAIKALSSLMETDSFIRETVFERLNHDNLLYQALEAARPFIQTYPAVYNQYIALLRANIPDTQATIISILTPFVETDVQLQQEFMRIIGMMEHEPASVVEMSSHVAQALSPLTPTHTHIRDLFIHLLDHESALVQYVIMNALSPVVGADTSLQNRLLAMCDGDNETLKKAAVQSLAPYVQTHPEIRHAIVQLCADDDYFIHRDAVNAISPLVKTDQNARQAFVDMLASRHAYVRCAAIEALTPLVAPAQPFFATIMNALQDESQDVRRAATQAIAPFIQTDAAVYDAVMSKLNDSHFDIRVVAVDALCECIDVDPSLRYHLLPWVCMVVSESGIEREEQNKTWLNRYGRLLTTDAMLFDHVQSLLDATYWPIRKGPVMMLLAMPDGPPASITPQLHATFNNFHSETSWPRRLYVAELFLNHPTYRLSQRALAVAADALDYGREPWYCIGDTTMMHPPTIRKQAATILGKLDPLYRDEATFARLVRVLDEDDEPEVRDAAYGALLRLAAAPEKGNNSNNL